MKLLFLSMSHYNHYYAGLSSSYLRALERSNIQFNIFLFKKYTLNRYKNFIVNKLPFLTQYHNQQQYQLLKEALKSYSPQVVFVIKGEWLPVEILKVLKNQFSNTQFVCFNPDDPFNELVCNNAIRKCLPFYDHYFIWTHRLIEKIKETGCPNVHYLPFGVDTNLIYPVNINLNIKDKAISFIGNCDQKRQNSINKISAYFKKNEEEIPIHLFGRYWKHTPNTILNPNVTGQQYLENATSSKVNLNILRVQNENSTNMRTFEIPAMNAFLLHEKSEEAQEIFEANKEMVFYETIEEANDKIIFYLKNETARKKIAQAGYLKIQEHTYEKRLATIVKYLNRSH